MFTPFEERELLEVGTPLLVRLRTERGGFPFLIYFNVCINVFF